MSLLVFWPKQLLSAETNSFGQNNLFWPIYTLSVTSSPSAARPQRERGTGSPFLFDNRTRYKLCKKTFATNSAVNKHVLEHHVEKKWNFSPEIFYPIFDRSKGFEWLNKCEK